METSQKTYKQGEIVKIQGKGEYEVLEDMGIKISIRRIDNSGIRLIVKKERLN